MSVWIRIEDLQESNIDDLINVCSSKRVNDPLHQKGMNLKRQWLLKMLRQHGSCAKIGYLNERPIAQILFHPEKAEVAKPFRRKDVLILDCIYNPTTEAQKLGIGTRLLKSAIQDARRRRSCLGNKPCKFITAKAFSTGELLPLPDFYKKNGFLPTPEGEQLYIPIEGGYEPNPPVGEYEPLPEDTDKAIVFYGPVCQFSYQFARRTEAIIREALPDIDVELINEWEQPGEAIKRKNSSLIVNARVIHTFLMETEKFKQEIRQAMG
jgi:predicted GNAT family acetyltransferase